MKRYKVKTFPDGLSTVVHVTTVWGPNTWFIFPTSYVYTRIVKIGLMDQDAIIDAINCDVAREKPLSVVSEQIFDSFGKSVPN